MSTREPPITTRYPTLIRRRVLRKYTGDDRTSPRVPASALGEIYAFPHLKVLVPPPGAGEPQAAEEVFGRVRAYREGGGALPGEDELRALHMDITGRWRVNYSMLDETWYV